MGEGNDNHDIQTLRPYEVRNRLKEGKVSMEDRAFKTGLMKIAKAFEIESNDEFVWIYIHGDDKRNGCSVKLTREETAILKDTLDDFLHRSD